MGNNFDEQLLLSKKVDESLATPPLHQAMRIALYDEFRARAFYTKVMEFFGNPQIFQNISLAEQNHIDTLTNLFYKYQVPPVVDDWYYKVKIEPTLIENCQAGVNAELENITMYDTLLPYVDMPDVKDIFYRLQAASYNNHLPAFRSCIANANELMYKNFNVKQEQNSFGNGFEFFENIKDIASGKADIQSINKVVSNLGSDFLIGAGIGALVVTLFSAKFQNKDEE